MKTRSASGMTRSKGAALLLLIILLGLVAVIVTTSGLRSVTASTELQSRTTKALAMAKDAVLGYALANQDAPGGLPYPDRGYNDGNYDGNGDCVTSYTIDDPPSYDWHKYFLGRFPYLEEQGCFSSNYDPIPAFGILPRDGNGEVLWYAVSFNLVRSDNGTFPPINTSTLSSNTGWLTVRDESGTVISDKVAFVLFAPGDTLSGQDRSGTAPDPDNFLDRYNVGTTTYDNSDSNLDYIMANPVKNSTNQFNDRLIYVTSYVLMNSLVERVAREILSKITYPYPPPGSGYSPPPPPSENITMPGPNAIPMDSWFYDNEWNKNMDYTRTVTQVIIHFSNCNSTYTITHSGGNNVMARSGPC